MKKKEEGRLAFKVIVKRHRYGSNMLGYLQENFYTSKEGIKKVKEFFEHYPELKKYFPVYNKGKIIKKVPGSMGIFCFKDYETAESFAKEHFRKHITPSYSIIRVLGYKRCYVKKFISGCFNIFHLVNDCPERTLPSYKGSVTFNYVKVLD